MTILAEWLRADVGSIPDVAVEVAARLVAAAAIRKAGGPSNPRQIAQAIVDHYAAGAPDILRRDFYNSLLAAFTEDEVTAQLARMNLTRLLLDVPDDRHWVVGGIVY